MDERWPLIIATAMLHPNPAFSSYPQVGYLHVVRLNSVAALEIAVLERVQITR
jgi:hypothetical protein